MIESYICSIYYAIDQNQSQISETNTTTNQSLRKQSSPYISHLKDSITNSEVFQVYCTLFNR